MKHLSFYETFLPEYLNDVHFFNLKLANENTLLRLIPYIKRFDNCWSTLLDHI